MFNSQFERRFNPNPALNWRVLGLLKPDGYFCIGHSESLNDIPTSVEQVAPSIYRKPRGAAR